MIFFFSFLLNLKLSSDLTMQTVVYGVLVLFVESPFLVDVGFGKAGHCVATEVLDLTLLIMIIIIRSNCIKNVT